MAASLYWRYDGVAKAWSLTRPRKNTSVRTKVTRPTTVVIRKYIRAHVRLNRPDAGGTNRALLFSLGTYVPSLCRWLLGFGVRRVFLEPRTGLGLGEACLATKVYYPF